MWLVFVMVDYFNVDTTSSAEQVRIPLPPLTQDRAYFVKFDQRQLVVMHYSAQMLHRLFPAGITEPAQYPKFLVAYALGTNLGCPLLVIEDEYLKESCSSASYDFAGRPRDNNQNFTALRVPVYSFCPDFSCIKIQQ